MAGLYCSLGKKNCIAILVLYCDLKASRVEVPVSQYTTVYCDQEEN